MTSSISNTVNTFSVTNLKSAKYIVTLTTAAASRTSFEVLVVYNGSSAFGTVYGIVDAQASSLLTDIDASVTTTLDLDITPSANCTAIIHGVATYDI